MEKELNHLLNELESIATTHQEVLDTYVREKMMEAAQILSTPAARLAAFQNMDVLSKEGNTVDEFFGYADKP